MLHLLHIHKRNWFQTKTGESSLKICIYVVKMHDLTKFGESILMKNIKLHIFQITHTN